MTLNLPKTLKVDFQPYGLVTLADLKEGSYTNLNSGKSYPLIVGTVIEGKERSYLLGHTSDRSIVGQQRTVYGVKQYELDSGLIVRVAM